MNDQNLEHNTHHAKLANEAIAALTYSFFEATGRLERRNGCERKESDVLVHGHKPAMFARGND